MADPPDLYGAESNSSNMVKVEQLINRLYQPGNPQDIAETQKHLQRLQRSNEGWHLADALLQSQDEKVRFFGALTFTIKINSDWDQLEVEDTAPLLHRLLHWITLSVQVEKGHLVARKLCTSLVAYFLRPTVSWNRSLLHLVCCFTAGEAVSCEQLMSTSDKDAARIVPRLGREQLLASIWFALNLIEEVEKTSPTSILTSIISTLDDVVMVLQHALQIKPDSDRQIVEAAVKCFQAWVTYAHGVWSDKPDEVVFLRRLTPYCINLLWAHELCEVTADCLGDILNPFSAFFTPKDLELLLDFLTSTLVQVQLSALHEGNWEPEFMSVARLLLAYGDARLHDLAHNLDTPSVQMVMHRLMDLLTCVGYAGAEDDICTPALEFWQSFTEFLIDALYGSEDVAEPWMGSAQRYVVQAIDSCWVKIRFPPENVWAEWSSEEKGDFRAFRADVEDLLQSSYTLLGTSIFDRLTNLALEALNNHAWLHLEATLFCLNALAETISDDDVVDTTLIHLFRSELLANMMDPALNMPYKTQQTAVTTMVSFTAFFERHTQFLPSMLTFLFTSLQSPALAGVAARAIFTTCDTCRKTLVSEIGAFLHQYEAMLQWQDVESTTKEKVIGAIAAITQAISSEEHRVETFDRLLYFVHRDVEACKEFASVGAMGGAQEKGLCALRCLINMGNTMQEPDPDGEAVDLENEPSTNGAHESRIWESCHEKIVGFIYAVSSILGGDGEVVEAACQVLRTGYKEATPGPFVFPPKVTEDFVTNSSLQTPRLEYVLDTAGAMLTRHTRANASRVDATAIASILVVVDTEADDPANEPEVSASCLDLAAKFIPHYLHTFLYPQCREHIADLIIFSIRCMACQEIMLRRAAANFWALLFQRYDLTAEIKAVIDSILGEYGPHATLVIMHSMSGEVARSELETFVDPLKRMVFSQVRAKQWISDALFASTFPSSKVGDAQKRKFIQQVAKSVIPIREPTKGSD
ncbi:MAG: hypothetical protein Q9208_002019 [Pyrenodesmia sp. 3 TL-2023]